MRSSQIEGTQSSLSDLLLFEIEEAPCVPFDAVREVSNDVRALEHGVKRVRGNFPISSRLFREVHAELLARGRGSEKPSRDSQSSSKRASRMRSARSFGSRAPWRRLTTVSGFAVGTKTIM